MLTSPLMRKPCADEQGLVLHLTYASDQMEILSFEQELWEEATHSSFQNMKQGHTSENAHALYSESWLVYYRKIWSYHWNHLSLESLSRVIL